MKVYMAMEYVLYENDTILEIFDCLDKANSYIQSHVDNKKYRFYNLKSDQIITKFESDGSIKISILDHDWYVEIKEVL